jgi:hypothetical protein
MATKLLDVTLFGSYYGQQVVNHFNYKADGDVPASGMSYGLNDKMGFHPSAGDPPVGSLFEAIIGLQVSEMEWAGVLARAMYDPLDFNEVGFNPIVTGLVTSADAASPIYAFGVRTNRTRLDIGRGYKRFGGVSEDSVEPGGTIESGALTGLGTLATKLGAILTFTEGGATVTYTPCILKKEKIVDEDGKVTYRKYATEAEQLEHIATGIVWTPYTTIRSQVSRQYDRGD